MELVQLIVNGIITHSHLYHSDGNAMACFMSIARDNGVVFDEEDYGNSDTELTEMISAVEEQLPKHMTLSWQEIDPVDNEEGDFDEEEEG